MRPIVSYLHQNKRLTRKDFINLLVSQRDLSTILMKLGRCFVLF